MSEEKNVNGPRKISAPDWNEENTVDAAAAESVSANEAPQTEPVSAPVAEPASANNEPQADLFSDDNGDQEKKPKNKKTIIIAAAAAAAVILAVVVFLINPFGFSESEKQEIYANGTFMDGITVDGVDVSGMSLNDAITLLQSGEAERKSNMAFTLNVPENEMTYTMDTDFMVPAMSIEDTLKEAILLGKRDENVKPEKKVFTSTYTCDDELLKKSIAKAAEALNVDPTEPEVVIDPTAEIKVYVAEGKVGIKIDEDALLATLKEKVTSGDYAAFEPASTKTDPIASPDSVNQIVKRTTYFTSFNKSPYNAKNRVYNVHKCVEIMTASEKMILEPGEEFNINDVLGPRYTSNGWKLAPGYTGGRSEDQPGGGVCQVSTTLYGAVLSADLEIVDRINHSIPIGYAPKGLDATISTGGPDFIFKNNTNSKIYMFIWATDDNKLYIEIYGEPFDGFDEIKLESYKIKTISASDTVTYITDNTLKPGTEEVWVKKRDGSLWGARKLFYKEGELVKTEELQKSTYRAFAAVMKVGPSLAPSPVVPDPGTNPDPGTSSDPSTTPDTGTNTDPSTNPGTEDGTEE